MKGGPTEVEKDEIDASAMGDTLTIKGQKKAAEGVSWGNYYLWGHCYGMLERSLSAPTATEFGDAEAGYDNSITESKLTRSRNTNPIPAFPLSSNCGPLLKRSE